MCGRAGAYHVEKEADVRRVDGQIEIRVVTDDQRTLPAELESNTLQVALRRGCAGVRRATTEDRRNGEGTCSSEEN
jgi:hypothetical protein